MSYHLIWLLNVKRMVGGIICNRLLSIRSGAALLTILDAIKMIMFMPKAVLMLFGKYENYVQLNQMNHSHMLPIPWRG